MKKDHHLATRVVHAGRVQPRPDFSPTVPPVYLTTTFAYERYEQMDDIFFHKREGYVYGRYGTPTHHALEDAVAELEGADAAFSVASGMAAVHLALLAAGAAQNGPVLMAQDVYGASLALAEQVLAPLGVPVHTVDATDPAQVARALEQIRPAVLFFEVITNPLTKVVDAPRLIELAHEVGTRVVVDNTFTTPLLFRPFEHGADIVIHSATKYLAGHGDTLAGLVLTREALAARMDMLLKQTGANLGPVEAWLTYRGLKTLALRFPRQCENAMRIAQFLAQHPRVERVYYPGLPDSPYHGLADRLFGGEHYGAIVAFDIKDGNKEQVFRFLESLELCLPVTTLGDIYTTVLYPARSSHHYLSEEERAAMGIGPGLVRLSAGIEDAEDLIADLDQALERSAR